MAVDREQITGIWDVSSVVVNWLNWAPEQMVMEPTNMVGTAIILVLLLYQ